MKLLLLAALFLIPSTALASKTDPFPPDFELAYKVQCLEVGRELKLPDGYVIDFCSCMYDHLQANVDWKDMLKAMKDNDEATQKNWGKEAGKACKKVLGDAPKKTEPKGSLKI